VLHVGQHKTGSKALQSFCAANAGALGRAGICYPLLPAPPGEPVAYARSHYRLFAALRDKALGRPAGPGLTAAAWFEWIEQERCRTGAPLVLLSAEDLFDAQTAHSIELDPELIAACARLIDNQAAARGWAVRVVVYLRRQDHLIAAHYAQFIKGAAGDDLGLDEFARAFAPRLDARRILLGWEAAFGRERILVRAYEPASLPDGIVPDFFAHALGVPIPEECVAPPPDVEVVNRTPPRDVIEVLRGLNRRAAAGFPVPPRGAVLEAAFRLAPESGSVADWLSPAERRSLLERYAAGNEAIAADFFEPPRRALFLEPLPAGDESWRPYPGLSLKRAVAIERAIRDVMAPARAQAIGASGRQALLALHENLHDASYHQRGAIFRPHLEKLGFEVRDAVYSPRALLQAREGIVWLRRVGLDPDTAAAAARLGKRIVYDVDDAVLFRPDDTLPEGAEAASFVSPELDRRFVASVRAASAIVAGNHNLAAHARALGARQVTVVPTGVDVQRYPVRQHAAHPVVKLVWIGSGPTSGFLFQRRALFEKLQQRWPALVLRVVCDRWPEWDGVAVERAPWTRESEGALLADCDIGISPMPDTPYTRGKCGYKLVQYLAAGLPAVASPVGCHEEVIGDAGVLARSDDEWLTALAPLIEDASLRAELGARGRARVTRLYDLPVLAPQLAAALRSAALP
jgi:glycosyltransferase involved in cell wall biosynthesis